MNAFEIIENVRALNADVVLENNKLVIRGKGQRLPDELSQALREHKAEVMVALGAPLDVVAASILTEIRPFLPAPLKHVSDANLLAMVNWSVMHAWNHAARSAGHDR